MVANDSLAEILVEQAVRQIKLRPYLSGMNISSEAQENWKKLIESVSMDNKSPLTRFGFNTEDYKLAKKGRVISLHLRGIITGEKIEEYYQKLLKMGDNERRYFGRFSSEHEFESMIHNEYVRNLLSKSPHSLLYRLNDYNPYVSGSGHRKRRPLLVFEQATDEEVRKMNEIEKNLPKSGAILILGSKINKT